ncbi:hypothetical protein PR048_030022 [Dryococelus australis]|uniref:Uncharacterized protein n=1 Tax=Dryococelus australis TaxID=614101 RepID=A0ABQ9G7S2_9NEOP|nr:hypothetical protein PR048_030022 [Dryococelus australis]
MVYLEAWEVCPHLQGHYYEFCWSTQITELYQLYQTEEHHGAVRNMLATENIEWHFAQPRSPHFGGLWETVVKSLNYHLQRVVGAALLAYEEMYTYLTQIEAFLNSHPLTPLSSDPNVPAPLTPGHFLIGDALTTSVEPHLQEVPFKRLS